MRFTKNTRILVIDTETTNTHDTAKGADMSDVLVYDCGWAVCDIHGNIYETASYVNRDIFYGEPDLMDSAFYAKKLPQYYDDIAKGSRIVADIWEMRRALLDTIERYNIHFAAAYNARFDANAMNRTIQFVTKSFCRYFFPFASIEWLDIMKMAQDAVVSTRNYKTWATDMGYTTNKGVPRKTAEMLYQYMTGEEDFKESHTGLEDVIIEAAIMAFCFSERDRRKVKMRTLLYENPKEYPEPTEFQRLIMRSLKDRPSLRYGGA